MHRKDSPRRTGVGFCLLRRSPTLWLACAQGAEFFDSFQTLRLLEPTWFRGERR